jgi:hypothetical protein
MYMRLLCQCFLTDDHETINWVETGLNVTVLGIFLKILAPETRLLHGIAISLIDI